MTHRAYPSLSLLSSLFSPANRLLKALICLGLGGGPVAAAPPQARFFYATLPEGEVKADLVVHAQLLDEPESQGRFLFRIRGTENWQEAPALPRRVSFDGQTRWLFQQRLQLEPEQEYDVRLLLAGRLAGQIWLRSLPAEGQPLCFVDGGDSNIEESAAQLFRAAARNEPDFWVMGGDYAYDNGESRNWQRFDRWLQLWSSNLVGAQGRCIPLLPVLGNHEVEGGWGQSPVKATFWWPYFNQGQSHSYAFRNLGGYLGLWSLDSGHVTPHGGQQAAWLDRSLSENPLPLRLASYHVPLYPSCRDFEHRHSRDGRQAWLPLFDRHRLSLALEHHDHALKRTHPLRAGQPTPGGTVFLGDGCFGQQPRQVHKRPYLAQAASLQHYWLLRATPEKIEATALDASGKQLDHEVIHASP